MPPRWRTAPPSGNEFVSRPQKADAGRWGVGGRSGGGSRLRGRYDRTLRRRSEADRWGRGPLEADESTRGEVAERSGAAVGRCGINQPRGFRLENTYGRKGRQLAAAAGHRKSHSRELRKVLAVPDVASEESSLNNFGLVIAYVLPGFTALQGFPLLAPASTAWGTGGDPNPPLTAFLSGTVMALAAGLTVSAVRWLVIDRLHHLTGLRRPPRDYALLERNVAALEYLDLVHYRYYKFYANMVVALLWSYAARDYALGWHGAPSLALAALFLLASRDTLSKFYKRTAELMNRPAPEPLVVIE